MNFSSMSPSQSESVEGLFFLVSVPPQFFVHHVTRKWLWPETFFISTSTSHHILSYRSLIPFLESESEEGGGVFKIRYQYHIWYFWKPRYGNFGGSTPNNPNFVNNLLNSPWQFRIGKSSFVYWLVLICPKHLHLPRKSIWT